MRTHTARSVWHIACANGRHLECEIHVVRDMGNAFTYETHVFYNGDLLYIRSYATPEGAEREAEDILNELRDAGWRLQTSVD